MRERVSRRSARRSTRGTSERRVGLTMMRSRRIPMKTLTKSVLAAVAAGGLLTGCASYDYGYTYTQPYGYTYSEPYAYGYDYGYDYGPYYYGYGYGPSYYSGPSIGFTFRDNDRRSRDYRNYRGSRNDHARRSYSSSHGRSYGNRSASTRPTVTHPQRNVAPARSHSRPAAPPAAQARNDPWGGTNNRAARNSQQ
jgi:hypothetical protein